MDGCKKNAIVSFWEPAFLTGAVYRWCWNAVSFRGGYITRIRKTSSLKHLPKKCFFNVIPSGLGTSTRWWFQIFFIFTPTWERFPIWRAYFSNGWLKPPTKINFQPSMKSWMNRHWKDGSPWGGWSHFATGSGNLPLLGRLFGWWSGPLPLLRKKVYGVVDSAKTSMAIAGKSTKMFNRNTHLHSWHFFSFRGGNSCL